MCISIYMCIAHFYLATLDCAHCVRCPVSFSDFFDKLEKYTGFKNILATMIAGSLLGAYGKPALGMWGAYRHLVSTPQEPTWRLRKTILLATGTYSEPRIGSTGTDLAPKENYTFSIWNLLGA